MRRTLFLLLSLLQLSLTATAAKAAPVGADLERACSRALREGFTSEPGAACVWYGTPCACDKAAAEAPRPRSCAPANLNDAARARALLDGFTVHPELRAAPVQDAADRILAERFPCAESAEQPPRRE